MPVRPWAPRWDPGPPTGVLGQRLLVPALLLAAVAAGILSTLSHMMAIAALAALAVVAWVWARPAVAAYLVIVVTPLTAGIDRGLAIPVFRPSEALALLVGGALAARGMVRWRSGAVPTIRLDRVEAAMVLLAVTSSIVPLLWMTVRQRQIIPDDLLYGLVMWKYLGVYAIVRFAVTTVPQVRLCLWLSLAAACAVAVIAILQAMGLFDIPRLLGTYYAPFGHTDAFESRGGATLGLPAAAADLFIYNLAVASGLALRLRRHRLVLIAAAALLIVGTLSAGEFSSAVGLLIGVLCIAIVTGNPRLLGWFVVAAAGGSQLIRPVIDRRLSGFASASGLPVSWTGRLRNLQTYFWPKLFSDGNFLLGVRPSARVAVSSQATGYVWIESGYTWLLWGGGIPLLASFLFFVHAGVRRGWRAARHRRDAVSVAGIGAFVAVIVATVLMTFDPHLTYRGSAEALFGLLALAAPRTLIEPDGAETAPAPALHGHPSTGGTT
jgi:hypothetical protein